MVKKEVKVPRNQKIWERHLNSSKELVEILTSDVEKKKWFLYDVESNGDLTLKATGQSPLKLKPKQKQSSH